MNRAGEAMIQDADEVPRGTVLSADVVIVGAGPAGIALALELANTNVRVVVLESGGREVEQATTDLAHVVSSGEEYPVDISRLRALGGTTNHWGGWCRPHDDWVFDVRPWVADVGWPVGRADLAPSYARAARLVELPTAPRRWSWDWPYWAGELARAGHRPVVDDDTVTNVAFRLSPPTRFGERYGADLERARNITVVLHATAMQLETDDGGSTVTSVPVGSIGGNRFSVTGRVVVVAVGGIETPRLLLLSNRVRATGIGNEHDLVGRYFMDHPEGFVGTVELSANPAMYLGHALDRLFVLLTLAPDAMRRDELLGCAIGLDDSVPGLARPSDARTGVTAADVGRLRTAIAGGSSATCNVLMRSEPRPSASSRVVLSNEPDELGLRRLELQYALSPANRDSVEKTLRIVGRALGAAGTGRLRIDLDDTYGARFDVPDIGFHHMGTTRMAADPRKGVVDADLKVHGTTNLFIASSSVFPTAGFANPTFTILALTLRLADHLKSRLR